MDEIEYTTDLSRIDASMLTGFFVNWPNPPDPDTHLRILQNSHLAWIALHNGRCVGFINAISDSIFYAFIPLLEVLPEYQGQGIGKGLATRMLHSLHDMYAVDVVCDESVAPFYESLGYVRAVGMIGRNYHLQNGDQGR